MGQILDDQMKSKSRNVRVCLCNAILRSNPLFSDLCLQQERHHNDDSFTTLGFFLDAQVSLAPTHVSRHASHQVRQSVILLNFHCP